MNYHTPAVIYWIFSILMAISLEDIFYCLTGKFIIQNGISDYEEYKFFVFIIFIGFFIYLTCKSDYKNVYWQTTFIGAYSFVRVKI